jgi:hypothetical protein
MVKKTTAEVKKNYISVEASMKPDKAVRIARVLGAAIVCFTLAVAAEKPRVIIRSVIHLCQRDRPRRPHCNDWLLEDDRSRHRDDEKAY